MILDSSALIALLRQEAAAEALLEVLGRAPPICLSAATLLEARIVMANREGSAGIGRLSALLARTGAVVKPVTVEQADLATAAFLRFGKGRHPAALNFGDCFTYALALDRGEPILCIGNDFKQTDAAVVPLPPP